ncbi:prolyl aminopeptidase [soil metagenome]
MQKDAYTNQELMFEVGDGHQLYVYDWGNKDAATPIIFLHGGPGSAVKDRYKGAFDPLVQRVIFYDQRGCGSSTPFGSLENNTTTDLVSDISKIADELGINTFILNGNSWGSTLALAYANANPERVTALVIGGIFTGSKVETDWVDQGHFKTFYPEIWQKYVDSVPTEHRVNPSAFHFDKILNGTAEEQKLSAYAYERLEGGVMLFDDRQQADYFEDFDPAGTRIEVHYLANGCFMPDRYILKNAHKLTMPVHIVQGRYDMVCPPTTAYEIHRSLPNSQLYWTLGNHVVEHEGQNLFRSIIAGL